MARAVIRTVLLLIAACDVVTAVEIIKHPAPGNPDGRNQYQVDLLDAVMNVTVATHGAYELRAIPSMPQARELAYLEEGKFFDVVWTVTDSERETDLLPVRFPILRGMLGHRVCMIRLAEPLLSSMIANPDDDLTTASETSWPDTQILLSNGIKTELGSDFMSILKMLQAGRINCFPRGINEIEIELANFGTEQLGIDTELSFLYFSPMYYFVAPGNEALAERLQTGLTLLHDSGEFEALFQQYHDSRQLMQRLGMEQRTAHCLENPDIPASLITELAPMLITGAGTYSNQCMGRE